MKKEIMDEYIKEFMKKKEKASYAIFMKDLLDGNLKYSFKSQQEYENPEYLEDNFRNSVLSINENRANKDVAIQIYKDFLKYLKKEGISAKVEFPPIPVCNSFERHMYVAKYLQDPNRERDDQSDRDNLSDIDILSKKLWIGSRTLEKSMRKLRGRDGDPIQVCKKAFIIPEKEIRRGDRRIRMESTAHPLLLAPNLTQVIIMLKGLKAMSEDRQYKNYAETIAADIWEQLSDYAKERIRIVFSKKMSEDFTWYKSLKKPYSDNLYLNEQTCSVDQDVIMYCMKNEKSFCVEVLDGDKHIIYENCTDCHRGVTSDHLPCTTFITEGREITVLNKNILRSAYIREELL